MLSPSASNCKKQRTIKMNWLAHNAIRNVSDAHLVHIIDLGVERAFTDVCISVAHSNLVATDFVWPVLNLVSAPEVTTDVRRNDVSRRSCKKPNDNTQEETNGYSWNHAAVSAKVEWFRMI